MVNNVLGFPGIFRGALLCGASHISTGMKLAAAQAVAALTEESELVPDALDAHAPIGGGRSRPCCGTGGTRSTRPGPGWAVALG